MTNVSPLNAADTQRSCIGRLIVIVGPSGAGKDTLMDRARAKLGNQHHIRFVQQGREADDAQKDRLARNITIPPEIADVVTIDNSGTVEEAARKLVKLIARSSHRMQLGRL